MTHGSNRVPTVTLWIINIKCVVNLVINLYHPRSFMLGFTSTTFGRLAAELLIAGRRPDSHLQVVRLGLLRKPPSPVCPIAGSATTDANGDHPIF